MSEDYRPAYAEITLSVYEPGFAGFAPVAQITIEQWEALPTCATPCAELPNHFIADLMADEHTLLDDKWVSDAEVEKLLGQPAAALVSLGRQRLAQINDEYSEHIRKLIRKVTP